MPLDIYLKPHFEIDLLSDKENNYRRIIGIDEVGRGSWAGPVAIGVYFYDLESEFVSGITDSKKLSIKKRESAYRLLSKHNYSVKIGSVQMIDKYGIGKTIEKLILQTVNLFNDGETFFLIDGTFRQDFGIHSRKIIKGDLNHYSIAAASILAKVERDNMMKELSNKFTGYGFERNKGYGTKFHRDALKSLGITEIHRKSFKSIIQ